MTLFVAAPIRTPWRGRAVLPTSAYCATAG